MFYLLDPEKWERQKHFEYYMQMIPCGYTVTGPFSEKTMNNNKGLFT